MTKEITSTTVKVAKIEMVNGLPTAVSLPDEILLGNVSLEKAQKAIDKKYTNKVSVMEVHPNTQVYEMPVEDFIKHATLKTDNQEQTPSETVAEVQAQ